jgi:hypothetical protein
MLKSSSSRAPFAEAIAFLSGKAVEISAFNVVDVGALMFFVIVVELLPKACAFLTIITN